MILFYVNLPDGKRFVYSTGQKIPVRLWDSHSQIPKRTKSQNDQVIVNIVNFRLEKFKSLYLKLDMELKSVGKRLTKELLKQEFDIHLKGVKRKEVPNNFDSCFDDFYSFKIKEGSWSKSTAKRYQMINRLLKEFEKYHRPIEMNLLDDKWIGDFKDFCENIKFHQVNTVGRNIGLIKTFLNYCLKQGYIDNNNFKDVVVGREVTEQLALSKQDILLIEGLDLHANKRLERVRDVFLLGCYQE